MGRRCLAESPNAGGNQLAGSLPPEPVLHHQSAQRALNLERMRQEGRTFPPAASWPQSFAPGPSVHQAEALPSPRGSAAAVSAPPPVSPIAWAAPNDLTAFTE